MVLTQTCDLVRRSGGHCSARYVTVASVRSLDVVLQRQLEAFQDEFDEKHGFCSQKFRDRFLNSVRTLFNNNSHEYFYLRQEAEIGFYEDMCTFLRELIPLRTRQHYQTLLAARVTSLSPTFQAKLGWLVGDVFSRVATDDWVPKVLDQKAFEKLTADVVDLVAKWIDDRTLRRAKKEMPENLSDAEVKARVLEAKAISRKTEVLSRVRAVIEQKYPDHYPALKNLQETLASDVELKTLLGP